MRTVCSADGLSTHSEPCPSPANADGGCGTGNVCAFTCAPGFGDCNLNPADGCEVNSITDARNCGGCGLVCPASMACAGGACVSELTLRVESMSTTSCRTIDHDAVSGDDRGGIAVSDSQVFYTGDRMTVQALLTDLTGFAPTGSLHDGMLSDLNTGRVYILLDDVGAEVPGTALSSPFAVTQLGVLDSATGALSTGRIRLSTPIAVQSNTGVFSGRGRAYLYAGNSTGASIWYQIRLPSGAVTTLRTGAPLITHQFCESWAFWGVAEYFGGEAYALYAESSSRIVRYRVRDGSVTTLLMPTGSNPFGDLCSFTISPRNGRWYFHYEGSGFAGGVAETLGYCPATISSP